MTKLRAALEDDARHARYIETVARRGYRFAAPPSASERSEFTKLATFQIVYGLEHSILAPGENMIGRAAGCAVRIESHEVSRGHCRIMITAEGAMIEDLGSTNGTVVGGRAIDSPCELRNDDEIRLGSVCLTFRIGSGEGSSITNKCGPS